MLALDLLIDSLRQQKKIDSVSPESCPLYQEYKHNSEGIGKTIRYFCFRSRENSGVSWLISKHSVNGRACLDYITIIDGSGFVYFSREIGDGCVPPVDGP